MKLELTPCPQQDDKQPQAERTNKREPGHSDHGGRLDPRCEVETQAFVAMPNLPSRAYQVCEMSRGGMFLGFRDARSTALELERADVVSGTPVEIAFAVNLSGERHRVNVRARITRITPLGIGVQFTTRNPPQLAALRELFARAGEVAVPDAGAAHKQAGGREKRILNKPEDSAGWQDWELQD